MPFTCALINKPNDPIAPDNVADTSNVFQPMSHSHKEKHL